MSRDAIRPGTAGFALTETLVALLLLAVALLGAGAALVESLAAQHAALLQTRAADLAGDLAEALRRGATPETTRAELAAWRQQVRRQLPAASLSLQRGSTEDSASTAQLPADLDILLHWRADRAGQAATLRLPVALQSFSGLP